jgi:hypothetical protein
MACCILQKPRTGQVVNDARARAGLQRARMSGWSMHCSSMQLIRTRIGRQDGLSIGLLHRHSLSEGSCRQDGL